MQFLEGIWQSGLEGRYVEELINISLADFPPYAEADQSRFSMARIHGNKATAAVMLGDDGSLEVCASHSNGGSLAFSTSGSCQLDGLFRFPIYNTLQAYQNGKISSLLPDEVDHTATRFLTPPSPPGARVLPLDKCTVTPCLQPSSTHDAHSTASKEKNGKYRFFSTKNGTLFMYNANSRQPLQPVSNPGNLGYLEIGSLIGNSALESRQLVGLRLGPLSGRVLVSPNPLSMNRTEPGENTLESEQTTMINSSSPKSFTMECSSCIPLNVPIQSLVKKSKDNDRLWNPVTLTVGMQHPLSVGDSLLALCLQNNSVVPFLRTRANYEEATPNGVSDSSLLRSKFAPLPFFWQFLLVQTIHSKSYAPFQATAMTTETSLTGWSIMTSSKPWYRLGTLIGGSVSFSDELVRLCAAAVINEEEIGLETGVVIDATPFVPQLPSIVKIGWNRAGRIGLGITSLLYDKLCLTLGAHFTREDGIKFGLEIKC